MYVGKAFGLSPFILWDGNFGDFSGSGKELFQTVFSCPPREISNEDGRWFGGTNVSAFFSFGFLFWLRFGILGLSFFVVLFLGFLFSLGSLGSLLGCFGLGFFLWGFLGRLLRFLL